MNERVVTELVIDARSAVAGSAEYERAMTRAGAAVEKVQAKSRDLRLDSNLPRSVDRVTQAYDRLRSSIDPVTRAQVRADQEIRKAMALVDRAVLTGVATQQQAAATISGLRQRQIADIDRVRAAQMRLNSTPAVPQGAGGPIASGAMGAAAVGGVGDLRSTLYLLGTYIGVQQVADWADAWTSAGNQLRAVSQMTGTHTRSLEALNDMAKETRSGFAETVDLYAKLVRSSSTVARSEQELADATIIVNEAFKAGGAASQEQAAGILQLSQALSSGVLQGDELRSLRENAPLIAKAIADEFGTTIGGLKALGATGALTSERIFKAILKGGEDIHKAFEQTNSTLGEGFTGLGNKFIETLGHFDKATGFTRGFIAELDKLSITMDKVGTETDQLSKSISDFRNQPSAGSLTDMLFGPQGGSGVAGYIRDFIDPAIDHIDDGRKAWAGWKGESEQAAASIIAEIQDIEAEMERLQKSGEGGAGIVIEQDIQRLQELRAELGSVRLAIASIGAAAASAAGAAGLLGNVLAQASFQNSVGAQSTQTTLPGVTRHSPTPDKDGNIYAPFGAYGFSARPMSGEPYFGGGATLHHINVADYLAGKRAVGGPVSAGGTYLIGERGPELLHMGGAGNVSSASASAGMMADSAAKLDLIEQHGYDALEELKRFPGYYETIESDLKAMISAIKAVEDAVGNIQISYSGGGTTPSGGGGTGNFSGGGGGGKHYSYSDPKAPYYWKPSVYPGGPQYDPVADYTLNGNTAALGQIAGSPYSMYEATPQTNPFDIDRNRFNTNLDIANMLGRNGPSTGNYGGSLDLGGSAFAGNIDNRVRSGGITDAQARASQMDDIKRYGYATGGYTGNMPTGRIAGVVHGQEYVFDAEATRRIGIGKLEATRRGEKGGDTHNDNSVQVGDIHVNVTGDAGNRQSQLAMKDEIYRAVREAVGRP